MANIYDLFTGIRITESDKDSDAKYASRKNKESDKQNNENYLNKYSNNYIIFISYKTTDEEKIKKISKPSSKLISSIDELINKINQNNNYVSDDKHKNLLDDYYLTNNEKSLEKYLNETRLSREVEVDYLGHNVLGMYDPKTDTVYVLKNLPEAAKRWVKEHEHTHRRRAYTGESQNEELVDSEASMNLGYSLEQALRYAA